MGKGDDNDVPVTREDQTNINAFSKYHTRLEDLELRVSKLEKEQEYLEDLAQELELFDEDDGKVSYKIGDSFVKISLQEALERLEKENSAVSQKLDQTKSESADLKKKMEKLKVVLYAKFGKAINLEV